MHYYRSKKRALIDLVDKLDSLPPLHPERPRLVRMICDLAHEVFLAGNTSGPGQSSVGVGPAGSGKSMIWPA
jgi:hypothetical protein